MQYEWYCDKGFSIPKMIFLFISSVYKIIPAQPVRQHIGITSRSFAAEPPSSVDEKCNKDSPFQSQFCPAVQTLPSLSIAPV